MSEHGPKKVTCKKCGRSTFPTRQGNCFYCGKPLDDHAAVLAEPRQLGGPARFVPQGDDRRHYLVLETGGHVELTPGQLFVIGRDPHASLVVNSPDVSRQHCEVDWEEGGTKRPVLCEVRSKNGTYLNERLVVRGQREPLRSGDTVRLGPGSVLRYYYVTPRDFEALQKEWGAAQTTEFRPFVPSDEDRARAAEGAEARGASTRLQGLPSPGAPAPEPARVEEAVKLQGRLKDVSAAGLLKFIHEQRLTGVLTFFDGQERGEAHMEDGRCVLATYGQLTGREVIEKLVTLTEGGYRFRKASEERRERDPLPFPARGKLSDRPANELVAAIESHGLSGELSINDGPEVSADAVFVDGVWTDARFGDIVGKMAKHMIAGLRHGEYRFREADAPSVRAGERAPTREHEAVIAALVDHPDPAGASPWTGREAERSRQDLATMPLSALDPPTRADRDPITPPRPSSGADTRVGTSRAPAPPLRPTRGAPPPPTRPASSSGRQVAPPLPERLARSTAAARPTAGERPSGPRPSDRQPLRDADGRPASPPSPPAPSPLRPPSGTYKKEPPLREERAAPPQGTRPPLRLSGESGRTRKQPPPLPSRGDEAEQA